MNTTRRDFLKVSAGAVAATSVVSANSKEISSSTASGELTAGPTGGAGDMIYVPNMGAPSSARFRSTCMALFILHLAAHFQIRAT